MTIRKSLAPHVRTDASVRQIMAEVSIALLFVLVIPTVYYGPRILIMAGITVAVCVICELLFCLTARMALRAPDLAAVVTGLLIALLMPPNVSLWVPAAAGMFAILVAKMPFGGTGRTPFNPAAAGFVFAAVCWPEEVFSYADPLRLKGALPLFADCSGIALGNSPAALLQSGLRSKSTMENILLGQVPGPTGTTVALVLLACGAFLMIKRTANWDSAVVFLAVCSAWAAFLPRIVGTWQESVYFELTSGALLFCAVFLIPEPSTSPRTRMGRCLYGACAAILAMAMRYYGPYEQGGCFALLFVNLLTPALDRMVWKATHKLTLENTRRVFHRFQVKGGKPNEA